MAQIESINGIVRSAVDVVLQRIDNTADIMIGELVATQINAVGGWKHHIQIGALQEMANMVETILSAPNIAEHVESGEIQSRFTKGHHDVGDVFT